MPRLITREKTGAIVWSGPRYGYVSGWLSLRQFDFNLTSKKPAVVAILLARAGASRLRSGFTEGLGGQTRAAKAWSSWEPYGAGFGASGMSRGGLEETMRRSLSAKSNHGHRCTKGKYSINNRVRQKTPGLEKGYAAG